MPDPDLLLPPGRVLLHVGPPKTATTAVQSGFHHCREDVSAQGVHYAGSGRQPMSAAIAVTRDRVVPGWGGRSRERWPRLVEEVRDTEADRVVVSSEFFADGDDDTLRRVVDGLGGDRVHVVLTLRSVGRILPSQWQQFTQVYLTWSYERWLHTLFDAPLPDDPPLGFWRRHRHDVLARRWADVVGPENLTVVVADESDPSMVLHVFEDLTGLRRGTLVPSPDDRNRSLTLEETALVREVNRQWADSEVLDEAAYTHLFRYGLATHLKHRPPAADEARVRTPAWAVERARQVGAEAAAAIAASGVRVVGDLDALTLPPREVGEEVEPHRVPVEVAARAAMGVALGAAGQEEKVARRQSKAVAKAVRKARRSDGVPLRTATLGEIRDELRTRLRRRVGGVLRRRRGHRPSP